MIRTPKQTKQVVVPHNLCRISNTFGSLVFKIVEKLYKVCINCLDLAQNLHKFDFNLL